MTEKTNDLQPELIQNIHWGYIRSHVLSTAVELDVFTVVHAGNNSVEKVARMINVPLRSCRFLLDALVGMGLLGKNRGAYKLENEARNFLVRGEPNYLGSYLQLQEPMVQNWFGLTHAVKTGKPLEPNLDLEHRKTFFKELVKNIFPVSYASGVILCKKIGVGKTLKSQKVLDLGCGACPWSIAFCLADGDSQIVAVDFPEVLEVAQAFTKRFHVQRQFEFKGGDYHHLELQPQSYDVIILGQICHMEGEAATRKLFKKCYDALKPGGKLLVAEFIANDLRTGPELPLMFALTMLLFTEQGDVYTSKDLKRWLDFVGFKKVSTQGVQYPAAVMVGTK